ncbi:hypothetical protein [Streptomyces coeruleorubidus]|uniref:hypothetical protein n=1 Tax=Streptomyces coeruleorubidus TaxID=116188 RepID=UPI0018769E75|nr:hypothetical protein [Streptomyces bellus]GGU05891.1 hypothetical protein GCM10010244_34670 [Streptomyces bellus]
MAWRWEYDPDEEHVIGGAAPAFVAEAGKRADELVRAASSPRPRPLRLPASTPSVFKSDSLLADARALWKSLGDEAFVRLLPAATTAQPVAGDGLAPISATPAPAVGGDALPYA